MLLHPACLTILPGKDRLTLFIRDVWPTQTDCFPTWQVHGVSSTSARYGWQGIAATPAARARRDVRGRTLQVAFEITDRRSGGVAGPAKRGELDEARVPRGPYTVLARLQVGSGGGGAVMARCMGVGWATT